MRKFNSTFVLASILMLASPIFGVTVKHHRHTHAAFRVLTFHHVKWNPMFPPTHESLLRQNEEIDRLGLPRIKNDRELKALVDSGDLVPLPLSKHLTVDPHLPGNRRYCRPWTAQFLIDLSDKFYAEFHTSIQVNSAVRTVEVQKKLRRWNPNAAPISGETASSHLAGLTVDLERKRLTEVQAQWVENALLPLKMRNLVEVEEEYREFCFHIMVSGDYGKPEVVEPDIEISLNEEKSDF